MNAEVVELLEHWLAVAKQGRVNYVVLCVGLPDPARAEAEYVGHTGMRVYVDEAIEELRIGILKESALRVLSAEPEAGYAEN